MTTTVRVLIEGNKACEVYRSNGPDRQPESPVTVRPMAFTTLTISGEQAVVVKEIGEFISSNPEPQERMNDGRPTGIVSWFNDAKGFGYIAPDDGGESLFAHFSAINMPGFKTLKEGQKVSFEVTQGPKGKQASNIKSP